MNPRALAAWSAAALTVTLVSTSPLPRAVVLLTALNAVLVLARPGARLRPLALTLGIAAVTTVVLDISLSHLGEHVLLRVPDAVPAVGGPLTLEAALYGADVALGIVACALAVAPLALVLEPHDVVDALPGALHRTATATAAALNLLPGLGRSATAVRDAQVLRGRRPRAPRRWSEVAIPVLVTALESSVTLAEAMEARALGSGRRTRHADLHWSPADIAVATAAAVAMAAVVAARLLGADGDWSPFPTVVVPTVDAAPLAAATMLVLPSLLWRRPSSAR